MTISYTTPDGKRTVESRDLKTVFSTADPVGSASAAISILHSKIEQLQEDLAAALSEATRLRELCDQRAERIARDTAEIERLRESLRLLSANPGRESPVLSAGNDAVAMASGGATSFPVRTAERN
jgi:hypothetical protein